MAQSAQHTAHNFVLVIERPTHIIYYGRLV